MLKNRFFKNTLGFFAELAIVAKKDTSNAGGAQATYQGFITTATAGDLWAYWEDTQAALAAGDTALAANVNRSFFYAWKQGDGSVKRSTPIAVKGLKYKSAAYNAGTAQVRTATFGGTYAAGQYLHVKVIETTGTHLPFPVYPYSVKIGAGGINQAVTDIAALINAESADNDPIITAGAAAAILTLTSKTKIRNFKIASFVETTGAQPTDDSAIVLAETVKQVYPIGDLASVKELDRYANENAGGVTYTDDMYTAEELGKPVSNIDNTGATQYGTVLVFSDRTETGGVMNPAVQNRAYIVIAIRTADVAGLVAL